MIDDQITDMMVEVAVVLVELVVVVVGGPACLTDKQNQNVRTVKLVII